MSATNVQMPVKVENREVRVGQKERQRKECFMKTGANNNVPKRNKQDDVGRKFTRKRAYSFTPGSGKPYPPYKRRCKAYEMRPPTKFLLGGNINDPLNLNSLQDEAINRRMNAATPVSSPLPTPTRVIEVIIPLNKHDPLNLFTGFDDDAEYEQNLISPVKKNRKKKHKKKRNSLSGCSSKENSIEGQTVEMTEGEVVNAEEPKQALDSSAESLPAECVAESTPKPDARASHNLDLPLKKDPPKDKPRKCSVKDKIVSPVIPQSRFWGGQHGHRPNAKHHQKPPPNPQAPNFKAKNTKYQYGNYNRYYGYRNQNRELDNRLKIFFENASLFQDKDILDIGCNIGHITLSVARDLCARSVVGLDIDQQLINIARKNIRHYVNFKDSPPGSEAPSPARPKFFPISMPIVFGPVDVPGVSESPCARKKFPDNVTFVQGSYVLESDSLLLTEQAQFDVILCLSVTKWLHVNWGDAGLKQAFRRMFAQLRPGGKLILEAQGWDSYKKRKTLTETIYKNFNEIRFFPQNFTQFLLSEVGFSMCDTLLTPCHPSKGFQRPIQVFTKGSFSSVYSAPSTPFYQSAAGRLKATVYTPVVVSTRSVDEDETDYNCDVDSFRGVIGVTDTSETDTRAIYCNVDNFQGVGSSVTESSKTETRAMDCDVDSFQGVVCVTDTSETETRALDFEETASVSSLVTDANNMVVLGVRDYFKSCKETSGDSKPHVITTAMEHDSVLLPLRKLEERGDIELSLAPIDENGCVIVDQVMSSIKPNTCLVTIMLANNETGVVMPLGQISRCVRDVNAERESQGLVRILLHTDAAQSIGKMRVNVEELGVDYLTIVGHKFYGPRVGALYVRGRKAGETPTYPLLYGGGQEDGLRPGTPNTPMIVGLGEAARLVTIHLPVYQENMTRQRDHLEKVLQQAFGDRVVFNCRAEGVIRLPNTSSVCIVGDEPELRGYTVLARCHRVLGSVGAACHDQTKPSSVLIASGVSERNALNTIRLSVGRDTTEEDIEEAVLDLGNALCSEDLDKIRHACF